MYFITTKRMLEVCFSAHPNIQYRTGKTLESRFGGQGKRKTGWRSRMRQALFLF